MYRIALSYERGNKYAKIYVSTGGAATSKTTAAVCKLRREQWESSGADTVRTGGEDAAKPKVEDNTEEGRAPEIIDVITPTIRVLKWS